MLVLVTLYLILGKTASQISCIFSQANLVGTSQGLGDDLTYCMNVETDDQHQILRSTPSGRLSLLSFFIHFIGHTALAGDSFTTA